MFRAVPLPIIRSFPLHIRHWYISWFDDLGRAWKLHQTCMTYSSAECTVENSWWWAEELPETCTVWCDFDRASSLICKPASTLQTGNITLSSAPNQQLENHSTKYHRQQPLYNTIELLMMGIVMLETCWASNKISNKKPLLYLVGILFPHMYSFLTKINLGNSSVLLVLLKKFVTMHGHTNAEFLCLSSRCVTLQQRQI